MYKYSVFGGFVVWGCSATSGFFYVDVHDCDTSVLFTMPPIFLQVLSGLDRVSTLG